MTVIIDTGPLVAYLNKGDALHAQAVELLEPVWAGRYGAPASPDTVLDEGLTLLRRRPGRRELSEAFSALFYGPRPDPPPLALLPTTPDLLDESRDLHFERYDRALSFTDCTLIVHAHRSRALLASFDAGFEGLVERITPGV